MTPRPAADRFRPVADAWDPAVCNVLVDELATLRSAMVDYEARIRPWIRDIDPRNGASASNFAHYLAMRRVDLRRLQERLAWIGVSSLGRAETHVMANLDKVLGILHVLAGRPWASRASDEPAGYVRGSALLARNAESLFGMPPSGRAVRVMVTLPTEAASNSALVDDLVVGGMDIARINCAHDTADQWVAMVERVRAAAARTGRVVKVLMDLAGPKLRTGPLPGGPAVLKLRPERDAFGVIVAPALLGLRPRDSARAVAGAAAHVEVAPEWLAQVRVGDRIDLTDAREASRRLTVIAVQHGCALADCPRTTYLTPQTALRLDREDVSIRECLADGIAALPGALALRRGDLLHLVRTGSGRSATAKGEGRRRRPATIACTLPQALDALASGDRIWFDDGRIGGVVRRKTGQGVEIEITVARDGGEKLRADKGINLPDTALDLPALTDKDIADLAVIARHADVVGLSFAQSAGDVRALRQRLRELDAADLGMLLKIETRRGFEHLPEMLFAVMGARGRRDDRAGRPGGRVRLRADGRGAGGDPLGLRSRPHAGGVGDASPRVPGQDRSPLSCRDHGCRDGRARGVRDAEQGTSHPGRAPHAGRHPEADAVASIEEAAAAARAEGLAATARRAQFEAGRRRGLNERDRRRRASPCRRGCALTARSARSSRPPPR